MAGAHFGGLEQPVRLRHGSHKVSALAKNTRLKPPFIVCWRLRSKARDASLNLATTDGKRERDAQLLR
jgi:hypothetical protein